MRLFFAMTLLLFVMGGTGCNEDSSESNHEGTETTEGTPVKGGKVIVRVSNDPENFNPAVNANATVEHISNLVYQYLINVDPYTGKRVPQLAEDLPEISEDGLSFTYRIRDNAKWADGEPVTAEDYAFTLKIVKHPDAGSPRYDQYYTYISGFTLYEDDPLKFTVHTNERFFMGEIAASGLAVFPSHLLDTGNVMGSVTVNDLIENPGGFNGPEFKEFAEFFNSKVGFNPEYIVGSGPYRMKTIEAGQYFTLERVKDWWGESVSDDNWMWQNYPDEITFRIIGDGQTASLELKNGNIDVMDNISVEDYISFLEEGSLVKENFDLYSVDRLVYFYLGLNNRPSPGRAQLFSDSLVRKALAHLVNVEEFLVDFYQGYAKRVSTSVPPVLKDYYHDGLPPIPFSKEKATTLLEAAGWSDSDGDGVLDKVIDGKRVNFEFSLMYSNSSNTAEHLTTMFIATAKEVGIIVNPEPLEFKKMYSAQQSHDFDAIFSGASLPVFPPDFKESWHSDSWTIGGGNHFGIVNQRLDELIIENRREMDPEKRIPIVREIQQIIYDMQPIIFICSPTNKLAIHKKFRNAEPFSPRPQFLPNMFWQPENNPQ